jgi:outer membrane receptor protein involved in Fe transport
MSAALKVFASVLLLLLSVVPLVFAQTTVSGKITDAASGEVLARATVRVVGTQMGASSNEQGDYRIENLPAGSVTLTISYIGYQVAQRTVVLRSGKPVVLNVALTPASVDIGGLVITGESESERIKQSAMNVAAIELKSIQAQGATITDVMNRVTGVRIREDGGLGGNINVSVNGLQGKSVKVFIDGVPSEQFGEGLALNTIPVNFLERIEVYKGVVPVDYGADALGGAINLSTRAMLRNYVDASYTVSSFNTHRPSVTARRVTESGLVFGGSAFLNYSDNDYAINANVENPATGQLASERVRLFNAQYRSLYGQVELGVKEKPFADFVLLTASFNDLARELQNGLTQEIPWGTVAQQQQTLSLGLRYEKTNLLPNTNANLFIGFNRINSRFWDTAAVRYNWRGEVISRRVNGGETNINSAATPEFADNIGSLRLTLAHRLSAAQQLKLNITASTTERVGSDTARAASFNRDPLADPVGITSIATGLSYETNLLNDRLSTIASGKFFSYRSRARTINPFSLSRVTDLTEVEQSRFGWNVAVRYRLLPTLLVKTSFENAVRLPDRTELLGDFLVIRPNPDLLPEVSRNLNVGLQFSAAQSGWFLRGEVTGFLRDTQNYIVLLTTALPPFVYQNLVDARTFGVEAEVQASPFKALTVGATATYQDIRNRSLGSALFPDNYFGLRVPNQPYLFANLNATLNWNNALRSGDQIQVYWYSSYIKDFFVAWEIDGRRETKANVPTQVVHNAGVTYSPLGELLSLTLETFNLTDARVFDNFAVQKPGRAVSFKLRYFLQ